MRILPKKRMSSQNLCEEISRNYLRECYLRHYFISSAFCELKNVVKVACKYLKFSQ